MQTVCHDMWDSQEGQPSVEQAHEEKHVPHTNHVAATVLHLVMILVFFFYFKVKKNNNTNKHWCLCMRRKCNYLFSIFDAQLKNTQPLLMKQNKGGGAACEQK